MPENPLPHVARLKRRGSFAIIQGPHPPFIIFSLPHFAPAGKGIDGPTIWFGRTLDDEWEIEKSETQIRKTSRRRNGFGHVRPPASLHKIANCSGEPYVKTANSNQ